MADSLAAIEATIGNRCRGVKVSRGGCVVFEPGLGYSRVRMAMVATGEDLDDDP